MSFACLEAAVRVIPLPKNIAVPFIEARHYSRRAPIFWAAFGLENDGFLEGVVIYGQPSPPLQKYAFAARDFRLYELSRLVVKSENRNAASFLVGNSLRMLPRPSAVVSFADSAWGHCGIVYQSTNWLYTGATVSHDRLYMIDGVPTHPMTLRDSGITDPIRWAKEHGIATIKPSPKHRYFFFNGARKERKTMCSGLRYSVINAYPKANKTTYDAGTCAPLPIFAPAFMRRGS